MVRLESCKLPIQMKINWKRYINENQDSVMIKCFFKISNSSGNNNEITKQEFNDDNIKSAYLKTLKSVWDNFDNIENIFSEKVLEKIPADLHWELPNVLYLKTKEICSDAHQNWKVKYVIPEINENTTFEDLYEKWFKNLLGLI